MRLPAAPRLTALPLLLALAACGTPQEQCIRAATTDLRTLDLLIIESRQNLQRGYAVDQTTVYRSEWVWCGGNRVRVNGQWVQTAPQLCLNDVPQVIDRPRAIDLEAEKRKLSQMEAKRAELARAATPAIAQCKATYPE